MRSLKWFWLFLLLGTWRQLFTASLFIFSIKTNPSPDFSCWQAEGLFHLDKRKCPTCILTISCDKTFGRCLSNAAGRAGHAQLGPIQSCDVNYGRFTFMFSLPPTPFRKITLYVITLQIQGAVSESDLRAASPWHIKLCWLFQGRHLCQTVLGLQMSQSVLSSSAVLIGKKELRGKYI